MNIEFVERNFPHKQTIIGIDEAGRGPLAGPLSIASVSFSSQVLTQIHEHSILQGLNDSKKISSSKREKLFSEIVSLSKWNHVFISNKSIDKFGISLCIFRGIKRLIRNYKPNEIQLLIDGNYKFEKYFTKNFSFEYQSIIQGDSKIISIASASIIAKVMRDNYMKKLAKKYPLYGFEKHMGYGTKQHSQKINEFGLTKYHRKTYIHLREPGLFDLI